MSDHPRPTLAQLLASGELGRLFQQLGSWAAVARHLGVNEATLRKVRRQARERLPEAWHVLGAQFQSVPAAPEQSAGADIGIPDEPERLECGCWAGRRHSKSNCKWGLPSGTQKQTGDTLVGDFEDEEPTQPGVPPLPTIPNGHRVHKVSTLIDATTGEQKLQWIKTSAQNDERRDWLDAIRDMGGELPRAAECPLPDAREDDLLAVYPVGDPHIGLLSWREDAGENFDLDIAEQRYVAAFRHLIGLAPNAHEALIILIGDTAHADGQNNTTTKGTRVDVDGRTMKMARVIIRVARYAIDLALMKHGRVTMIVERGNHDELISAMLALALSFVYEDDPRVTIDTSPQMFHWFRFGANLIGTHHGDKVKPMDLLGVMAVDRASEWSETKHRRFYLGHYHHQIVKEVPGLICEYLPTLASSDAWHHAMGYRASKAMYMDVLHREWGHINRHIVGIHQLRGVAA